MEKEPILLLFGKNVQKHRIDQKLSQEQKIINLRDSVDLMINEVSDKQRQISSLNSALLHSRDSVSIGLNQIQRLTSDLQIEKNKYYKKDKELSDAKSSSLILQA